MPLCNTIIWMRHEVTLSKAEANTNLNKVYMGETLTDMNSEICPFSYRGKGKEALGLRISYYALSLAASTYNAALGKIR